MWVAQEVQCHVIGDLVPVCVLFFLCGFLGGRFKRRFTFIIMTWIYDIPLMEGISGFRKNVCSSY